MALKKRTKEKEKEIVKEFDAEAEIEELKARINRLEHGQFQPAKEKGEDEEKEKEE